MSSELELYLDEALPAEDMARIEHDLRANPQMLRQLSAINARRDSGVHSLGEIWRRHRLTCLSRDDLGSLLLGACDTQRAAYMRFHLDVVGCRVCQANYADLERLSQQKAATVETRRRKYFQSSAGYLPKK